jgi:hypothetical protein
MESTLKLAMKSHITATLLILTSCAVSLQVAADEASDRADDWEYGVEVYLWAANVDTTSPTGTSSEIRFTDLAEDLEFGFMAALGARRGKWGVLADVIYLDVDDDVEDDVQPGVQLKSLGIEGWIVNTVGQYQLLETERLTLNLLAGARYLWLEVPVEFRFSDPEPPGSLKDAPSESFLDGVVGVRGRWQFDDKWYATYHADVGAGDSDTTWQGLLAVGYRFDRFDAVFGYRYLDWSFDDGEALEDLNLSGIMAGIKFLL